MSVESRLGKGGWYVESAWYVESDSDGPVPVALDEIRRPRSDDDRAGATPPPSPGPCPNPSDCVGVQPADGVDEATVPYSGDVYEGAIALMRDSGEDVDDILRRAARNLTRLRGHSHEIAAPEQLSRDDRCPNPGCEGRQRRERGTVRTRVWLCGCQVAPENGPFGMWADDADNSLVQPYHASQPEPPVPQMSAVWVTCSGDRVRGVHPTPEGSLAAWRVALGEAQRREDAEWLPEASDAVHADQLSVATITRQS